VPKGMNLDDPLYGYLKDQGLNYEEVEAGHNPAVSKAQRGMMGADLARARAGKKTRTGMSQEKLEHYAGTSEKGLPYRKRKK